MILKSIILSSLVVGLSSCALVSPIFVDHNGVRRDVAQFINSKMSYSIADRRVLVAYAKGQQKILTAHQLNGSAATTGL